MKMVLIQALPQLEMIVTAIEAQPKIDAKDDRLLCATKEFRDALKDWAS
jgi:hypothetical protein